MYLYYDQNAIIQNLLRFPLWSCCVNVLDAYGVVVAMVCTLVVYYLMLGVMQFRVSISLILFILPHHSLLSSPNKEKEMKLWI